MPSREEGNTRRRQDPGKRCLSSRDKRSKDRSGDGAVVGGGEVWPEKMATCRSLAEEGYVVLVTI